MLKTASLFSLCIILPALVTGANDIEVKNLRRFSDFSGLVYQILDDFKDISLLQGLTIKSPRDKELLRPNIVLALGIEQATNYLERVLLDTGKTVSRLKSDQNTTAFVYEEIYSYFYKKFKDLNPTCSGRDLSTTCANNAF